MGHILRRSYDDFARVALRWTPEWKRKKGHPKNNMDTNSRSRDERAC